MPMRGRIPKKRDVPCQYLSTMYTYNGKECGSEEQARGMKTWMLFFGIYLFTDDSVKRSRMIKAWVMRLSFQAKTGGETDSNNNL